MINFGGVIGENTTELHANWSQTPNHSDRILIIGVSSLWNYL